MSNNTDDSKLRIRHYIHLIGIIVPILMLWNGVCDFIFAYSPKLNGAQYSTMMFWDAVRTANGHPHWMVMLAQTAGWLYPIYAMSYFIWWTGMRRAGFWLSTVPCAMLAYALLMIGGVQHAGFAYLSVLAQAKALVGSTDPVFYAMAERLLVQHFFWGDLTALVAFFGGTIWHGVGILSGRTMFPRWFIFLSPLGVLTIEMVVGNFLPAPFAGILLAMFGTWFMFVPTVAAAVFMWRRV